MSFQKINNIEFCDCLEVTHHDPDPKLQIEYNIYRFYFKIPHVFVPVQYWGFYCFSPEYLRIVTLDYNTSRKIIEGEILQIEQKKFNYQDGYLCPVYGYADSRYGKDALESGWNNDEYYDAYYVLNDYYKFKPNTLGFIRLQFGQFFYWRNKENRNIERPAKPTIPF